MKKITKNILTVAALALALSSCGGKKDDAKSTDKASTPEVTSTTSNTEDKKSDAQSEDKASTEDKNSTEDKASDKPSEDKASEGK